MYLTRIDQSPKVVFVITAIEPEPQPGTQNTYHSRNTSGGNVTRVDGFQLHVDFEVVRGRYEGLLETVLWGRRAVRFLQVFLPVERLKCLVLKRPGRTLRFKIVFFSYTISFYSFHRTLKSTVAPIEGTTDTRGKIRKQIRKYNQQNFNVAQLIFNVNIQVPVSRPRSVWDRQFEPCYFVYPFFSGIYSDSTSNNNLSKMSRCHVEHCRTAGRPPSRTPSWTPRGSSRSKTPSSRSVWETHTSKAVCSRYTKCKRPPFSAYRGPSPSALSARYCSTSSLLDGHSPLFISV